MSARLMQLLNQAAKLTRARRERVLAHLGTSLTYGRATTIVECRLAQRRGFPKCQAQHIVCNGQADGLQRYGCRGCGSTLSALTGTPLAGLRHRDKWIEQAQAMNDGLSVRKAAAIMDAHRTTAFRWRHSFLALPRDVKAHKPGGMAKADGTYVLRSCKGQRRKLLAEQAYTPRHRGGKAAKRGLSDEQVCPLLCCATGQARPRTTCWKSPTSAV
jgi:transposase-like protein